MVTAKSSLLSPFKSATAMDVGECPTGKSVRGRAPAKLPVIAEEESCDVGATRLAESKPRVIGKCSPTKNVAGRPSSTRSRTRWALRVMLSARAKFAEAPGKVARKIVWPPPKAMSGGIAAAAPLEAASGF